MYMFTTCTHARSRNLIDFKHVCIFAQCPKRMPSRPYDDLFRLLRFVLAKLFPQTC